MDGGTLSFIKLYNFGWAVLETFSTIYTWLFTELTIYDYTFVPFVWIFGVGVGSILVVTTIKKVVPFL